MAEATPPEGAAPDGKPTTPPPADPAPEPPATAAAEPAADDLGEKGQSALTKERSARKIAEKAAADAQAELKKIQDAQLSETEKLRKDLAEKERLIADATTREQESRVRVATIGAAAKLGFADPEDALGFLDRGAVEFDPEGQPTNVETLVADLLKRKQYLKSSHAAPSGSIDLGNAGAPAYSREQLSKMTPEQINANWDKIQQAAQAGKLT